MTSTTQPSASASAPGTGAGEPVVPVLAGQRDIYFGLQVAADPALYNTGLYIEATASLDLERLRAAVLATIDRAEAMRAVFTELDGELGQRVLPIEDFDVPIVDLRGHDAHQWMAADMARPMDIHAGPLTECSLLRVGGRAAGAPTPVYIYLKVHHLVCDGMGLVAFCEAVRSAYEGATPAAGWTLREVIESEQAYRTGPEFEADRRHWTTMMADRPDPVRLLEGEVAPGVGRAHARFEIDVERLSVLRESATRAGVRPTIMLIAAVAAFAHTRTGKDDLVFALPVSGRVDRRIRTTPSMVTSVLPLRVQASDRDRLTDLARRVDRALFSLLPHSRFRGEDLGRALAAAAATSTDPATSTNPAESTGPYRMFGLGVNVMSHTTTQTMGGEPMVVHALASGPVSDVEIQIQLRRRGLPAEVVIRAVDGAAEDARTLAAAFDEFLTRLADRPGDRLVHLDGADPVRQDEAMPSAAVTPALLRLRAGGDDPEELPPSRIHVPVAPQTTAETIEGILGRLSARHDALRTTLSRPVPILWTLSTAPTDTAAIRLVDIPGATTTQQPEPPYAILGEHGDTLTVVLDSAVVDPASRSILRADLLDALADVAAGREPDVDPVPMSLGRAVAELTAAATDTSALPRWMEILAPGAALPAPHDGATATEAVIPEPVCRRTIPAATAPTTRQLLSAVAEAVRAVYGTRVGTHLLVDVVTDLRPAGAERTTGPFQGLTPMRIDLADGSTTPVPGPALDLLRHLSPQVGAAFTAAGATGEIAEPTVLVGDYGLPTDHPVRVRVVAEGVESEGVRTLIVEVDPGLVADAEALADALIDAVARAASQHLVVLDPDELAALTAVHGEIADVWPLTPLQEGLYYQAQMDADADIYTAQFWLDFGHRIDPVALTDATYALLHGNPELRAVFVEHDGRPVQIIAADVRPDIAEIDLSDATNPDLSERVERILAEDRATSFRLDRAPLWRMRLIHLPGGRDRLVVNRRFLLWDGWSGGLFVSRLLAHLHHTPVPAREASLRDYLVWLAANGSDDASITAWTDHLSGYDEPALIAPRAAGSTPRAPRRLDVELGADLSARLRDDARSAGVTLNTIITAALNLTLSRQLGRSDVAFGSTVAGRPTEVDGIDTVIGLFLNTVPVRTLLRPDETVGQLLRRMQAERVEMMAHDHIGLARLQQETGHPVLFDVLYVLQNFRTDDEEREQAALHDVIGEGSLDHTHYPVAVVVTPSADIRFRLEYRDDLVSEQTATALLTRFRRALAILGDHLTDPVGSVDLDLPEDAGLDGPAHPLPDLTVSNLLAERAASIPDAEALVFGALRMTYADLDTHIDRVAHVLYDHGIGAESIVALAVPRSIDTVVALFAILRAGAAYLPLELDHPDDRLHGILADAEPRIILSHSRVVARFAGVAVPTLVIDDLPETAGPTWPVPRVDPDWPAYVIYTSGSTGRPKGVVTPYRGLTNMQLNHREKVFEPAIAVARAAGVQGRLRIAHTVSFAFDMSWEELLWLVEGHEVHVCDEDLRRDSAALVAYCARHRIDVINVTPTYAAQLFADGLLDEDTHVPPLVLLGGEAVGDPVWTALREHPKTFGYNLYGPTEYTINTLGIGTDESDTSAVGTPIWNTRAHLLDGWLRPVPAGVAGELYISGAGLARGYLGRPDLTAERFVADPFGTGGRLYRTGDLMRMRADGNLDFLGRTDDQVKVRGHRVELAEIDAALTALDDVAGSAVVAAEDPSAPGVKRLVAYLIPADPELGVDVADVRRRLAATLPDYMVPTLFASVAGFPMTVNGKLDVKALPQPAPATTRRAPRTDLERRLCAVFAEVLGLHGGGAIDTGEAAADTADPVVGVDDDFFELGGHSMAAMKLVSALRGELGAEITIRDLFEARTPAEIAARVHFTGSRTDIVVGPRPDRIPLSPAQERLWVLYRLDPDDTSYHYGHVIRLHQAIDPDALRAAVADLLIRHESLRTVIVDGGDGTDTTGSAADLVAHQSILPVEQISEMIGARTLVEVHTLDDVDDPEAVLGERARETLTRPFDLRTAPPIRFRLDLLEKPSATGTLAGMLTIAAHHIATDEWSDRPMLTDLTAAYLARAAGTAPDFAPLPVQYADYALWQRDRLIERGDEQLDFWASTLADLPDELPLPRDHARRPGVAGPAATETAIVDAATRARLAALASARGASMFMVVQAAVAVLLHRVGAGDDIPLGSPISGRNDPALDDLVGFFVDTQVLRTDVSGRPRFGELVERVRTADLEAFDHQDVPFQRIVERLAPRRESGRNPLFQVSVSYLPLDAVPQSFLGVGATFMPLVAESAKFDLGFTVVDLTHSGELSVALEYATAQFDPSTARTLLRGLMRVLATVGDDPDVPVSDIVLLDDAEIARLRTEERGPRGTADDSTTVVDLLDEYAGTHGDVLAVRDVSGIALTYADTRTTALRIADRLDEHLAGTADPVVAVLMSRGAAQLVALQGVLRSGAAYLPIDADVPTERVSTILGAARPVAVLADTVTASIARAAAPGIPTILLGAGGSPIDPGTPGAAGVLRRTARPDDAAYVIYTSGSTGTPKGVVVSHRNVVNVLRWRRDTIPGGLGAGDVVLAKTPVGFDGAVWELLLPFVTGATVVAAADGDHRDPRRLARLIGEYAVTTTVFVPSLLELFVDHLAGLPSLRHIIAGGEALPAALARRVGAAAPGVSLINAYGPTETTVVVTDRLADPTVTGPTVPIGRPVAGTELLVLDESLRRVPDGVTGELYVRGIPVTRGYLGRPDLTAAAYVADPTGDVPGARLYRTGDLVVRRSGELEYLGRADTQVKVRGNRVELGEIEACLRAVDGVAAAAVRVDGDRIIGWIVPTDPSVIDTSSSGSLADHTALVSAVERSMRRRLPSYMVPTPIVVCESFPYNHTGKLDRSALPVPDTADNSGVDEHSATAPRSTIETDLTEIFGAVLGHPVADVHADFFALGGHSLLAIRAINLIRDTLGHDLELRTLFDHPTVAGLAAHLLALPADADSDTAARAPELRRRAGGRAVLSYGQERMLTLHGVAGPTSTYNVPMLWRPGGPTGPAETIDPTVLRAAVADVVARHEVLRTRYPDQRPEVLDDPEIVVETVTDPTDLARVAGHAFDLATEIPIRVATTDDVALVTIHHIATDEWSAPPLRADLTTAYRARANGRAPQWPRLPLQYSDFAAWQRDLIEGGRGERQLAFWRKTLHGLPDELALPYDHTRPPRPSGRGDGVFLALRAELVGDLRRLAAATGTSMFMLMRTAVAVLLSRLGGGDDIALGTPVTVRSDTRLESLVGFFLNTVVLRTDLSGDPSATELLARVREADLAALANRDVPFERVVEAVAPQRSAAMNPLFQTMVVYVDGVLPGGDPERNPPASLPAPTTAKFDLSFDFTEDSTSGDATTAGSSGARVGGVIEYSTDLFDRPTVEAMAKRLVTILEFMAARPDTPLRQLDIRTARERRELYRPGPEPTTFDVLLDAAVERDPSAPALRGPDGRRTFGELHDRVRLIAARLIGAGIGAEDVVVVRLPRGITAMETIFGVLYAGAAYLPIEPDTPADRVAAMIEAARPQRIIDRLDDDLLAPRGDEASWGPEIRSTPIHPEHPAYLIFTSGSTGTPKGVVITHRGLSNLFASHRRMLHRPAVARTGRERLRVGHAWSLAFDASWQPQLWLLDGHEVSIVDDEVQRDAQALAATLLEQRWDFLELTPSHLRQLGGVERSMAAIGFGGEAISGEQWEALRALPDSDAYNLYGPTEATVDALVARVSDTPRPVIGHPVDGVRAYVLDDHLLPVADGVDGELYLAGAGLARGYLARGELTAERFVADPIAGDGTRMYRTGDVVRWTTAGANGPGAAAIEYRGRGDDQVKIRGHRVELGDVEAAMLADADVSAAIAVARGGHLIGYVVPARDRTPEASAIRTRLRSSLPDYMVPAVVVICATFPTLSNGKIDRRSLPEPSFDRVIRTPETPEQQRICEAFAEVLDLAADEIGIDDDFAELGGDSIVAMQLVARLRAANFVVGPRDVMTHRTPAELAARLRVPVAGQATEAAALPRLESGPVPATPIVRWLQSLAGSDARLVTGFHQSALLTVPAGLDVEALSGALAALTTRHAMLRARLVADENPWRFDIPADSAPVPVRRETDRDVTAVAQRAREHLDPAAGVMMSVVWLDFGDEPGRLLLQIHHLVVDGVSWRVVVPELIAAYTQIVAGQPVSLGPVPDGFAGWATELVAADRRGELPLWQRLTTSATAPVFSRPPAPDIDREVHAHRHRVTVDTPVARAVLGPLPARLRVGIDDVLLGALGAALPAPTLVDLEGHGREEQAVPGADLTGSVGWFTAVHPVVVGGGSDAAQQARALAATRAEIPDGGLGYGLLRHVAGIDLPSAAIEFNYLGRYRSFEFDGWAMAPESAEIGPGELMPAGYGLIINVVTLDGPDGPQLSATWVSQPGVVDDDTVAALADRWVAALTTLTENDTTPTPGEN
ncbi:non-ribosomal peptide synthetase [uncultured Gordonia sp.]|uniref:non-ribosomal peptide synthetase n=1 Tax=uncultured Gordonia sp. TaxID=198437 RepID=UPI00258F6969|nr:non-ribosomal peptide synthetase [uncultured Gordonia sp.]